MLCPRMALPILAFLALLVSPPVSAEIIVLSGGNLIDGTGAEPVRDAAVIIEGNRILYAGPRAAISIPPGARVIDTTGTWILPGLINAHVHSGLSVTNRRTWAFEGVTTIRDLGSNPDRIFSARAAAGNNPGLARLVAAGPLVTAPGGYPIVPYNATAVSLEVFSADDARAKVENLLDRGADIIKVAAETGDGSIPVLDGATIRLIGRIAHGRGTRLSIHITTMRDFHRAVDNGADDLAHMVYGTDFTSVDAQAVVDRGISWVPTLELWEGVGAQQLADAVANLRTFLRAGGAHLVALGTDYDGYDSPFQLGLPMREMELMSEAGMTPMQIIVAATRNAATVCNLGAQLGTLARGTIADILVVRGNPLADLHNLRSVRLVVHDGMVIRDGDTAIANDSTPLDLLRPDPAGPIAAYTNARLIDGTGADPIVGACIITQGDRILVAGLQSQIEIPTRAQVLSMGERTVMPGLIDVSVFGRVKGDDLKTIAAYGITTIRVPGDDEDSLARLVALDRKKKYYPRVIAAGPVITAQHGYPLDVGDGSAGIAIGSANKAGKKVNSLIDAGAGAVALSFWRSHTGGAPVNAPGDVLIAYVIRAARARGVPVTGFALTVEDAVRAAERGAGDMMVPGDRKATLSVLHHWAADDLTLVSCLQGSAGQSARNLRRFLKTGGRIAFGTGRLENAGVTEDWSPLPEIVRLGEAGIQPMEIITAATSSAARVCGLGGITGRLAPGYVADMIVIDGDPLADVTLLGQPWMVVLRGAPLTY